VSFAARHNGSRGASTGARRSAAVVATWLFVAVGGAADSRAQFLDSVVVKGLQDLEVYKTDAASPLLSRNEGDTAGFGRLQLFAGAEFVPGFQGVVVYEVHGGRADEEEDIQAGIEQAFLRYIAPGAIHVMVDAGRIVVPIGNFSKRYQSNVNPLIGPPTSYDISYPEGILVAGKVALFDYRIAVINRPLANGDWVPEADAAYRPAVELGITPTTGLRIGGYFTQGPYLGRDVAPMIPAGESWRNFDQRVAGIDLEFCRGYFELQGDLAFSTYDAPTRTAIARGKAWFLEPKYTWTPRFFTALRVERNDYPYIEAVDSTFWIDQNAAFYSVEAGVGWRFLPELLLKLSYSRDYWTVDESAKSFFVNGYSVAMQLSYGFDVRSWFEPKK
jgi:hypothetical protein